jgi:outer membrane protein TolC
MKNIFRGIVGFIFISLFIPLFGSDAWALSQFPELTCSGIPVSVHHADGSTSVLKFDVVAGPITSEGSSGMITFSTESDGGGTQEVEGVRKAVVTEEQTSTASTFHYVASDTQLITDPNHCDLKSGKCTVTFMMSDTVTKGSNPEGYGSAKAECSIHFTLSLAEAIQTTLVRYPDVLAARKAVEAAQAAQGPLWQRFAPVFTATEGSVLTRSAVNIPGFAAPNTANSVSEQMTFTLSPMSWFTWNAAVIAANSGRAQETVMENQLAQKVIGAYTAVSIARLQVNVLQNSFLKTLSKLQSDPKIASNDQLMNLLGTLISTTQSTLIAQQFSLVQSENQFKILTGISLDLEVPTYEDIGNVPDVNNPQVYLSGLYADTIPLFPSAQEAGGMVTQNSPLLKTAYFAMEGQKNTYDASKWSFFQGTVGFGPTHTISSMTAPFPTLRDNSRALTLGGGVSFDLFAYLRGRKAAKAVYESSKYSLQGQTNLVETAVDNDFFTYLQQVSMVCTLKPQFLKTLRNFGTLADLINSGKPFDPISAAANVPQALVAIQQLYAADIVAIASISDIHAQMGDLNAPESWDISNNPQDFCPTAKAAAHP